MVRCSVSGEIPANPDDAPVPNSDTRADGQHVDHWVMCPTEIIKEGFKRPIRNSYIHVGRPGPQYPLRELTQEEHDRYDQFGYLMYEEYPKSDSSIVGRFWTQKMFNAVRGCGVKTSMPQQIAETYAANPSYYGSTFCCGCGQYLPVGAHGEFVWDGTNDRVGT